MEEGDDKLADEQEDLREVVARLRWEHAKRRAELPAILAKEPVEMRPSLKRMIDSQDEYRERVRRRIRRALYG